MLLSPPLHPARRLRVAWFGASYHPLNPSNAATVGRFSVHHVTTSAWPRPEYGHLHRSSLRRWYPRCVVHIQGRGKKTQTTLRLDELPQGPIASSEPLTQEERGPAYPTVLLQARRNIDKFDGCVLLTRVGGFYELYFEHADEYGPLLNLKVAQKKTSVGPVPMVNTP